MTVSEFACAMYGCDIVKDMAIVSKDGETLYKGRMEFLRYAHEHDPKMWFANETIVGVTMITFGETKNPNYNPDYITSIVI